MERVCDIDVLSDGAFQRRMVWSSVSVLVVGAAAVPLALVVGVTFEGVDVGWVVALLLASLVALPAHELVHALFFKALSGGRCRISFGFEQFMLYTRTDDLVLSRGRMVAVLLAPAVLVTLALFGTALACGFPLMGWLLAVVHLAGCTGDMGMVRQILAHPEATHVQDTSFGIRLLR